MKHPARVLKFDDLVSSLAAEITIGNVNVQEQGDLRLFCYSNSCVYERSWNPINVLARGLIIDMKAGMVVATPFTKFFNHSESPTLPDLPFETFEKVDGSLIIIYWHAGEWRTATKRSFKSEQAVAARAFLTPDVTSHLTPGVTYLAEYVGPTNRIVVPYDKHELVLLSAYHLIGLEASREYLQMIAGRIDWRLAERHRYKTISHLMKIAKSLPGDEEGFVLRFENGHRIKIKGDEYLRLHRLVSEVTPLAIYDNMKAGADMDAIRRDLPEELWSDFDRIRELLDDQLNWLFFKIAAEAMRWDGKSDKELGLHLHRIDLDVRPFVFTYRKHNGDILVGKTRQALFKQIRPSGNRLAGYVPSTSINRFHEEIAA